MKGNIHKLKILFTTLVIVYPILSVYYSGFSSLTVADVLLLILLVPIFFHYFRYKKISIRKSWIPFLIFLVVQFLVLNLHGIDDYGIMRIFRFALYYLVIAIGNSEFFDINYGHKVLRNISLCVSIFGLIQAVGIYVFGVYIPGVLKFLPIMREELLTYGSEYVSGTLRVRSVFGEPAHLAIYLCVYLIISLLSEGKKNIREALIVTLCLIFSVSSTAYYLLFFIWGVYLLKSLWEKRDVSANTVIYVICVCFICVIGIIILFNSGLWKLFWERNFVTGSSISGRISGYEQAFNKMYTPDVLNRLFGHGYDDYRGTYQFHYFAGIPLLYWYMGYVGLGLFLLIILWEFIISKGIVSKMLIIVIFMLGFVEQIYVSYNLMLYMTFSIFFSSTNKRTHHEERVDI